MKHEILHEHERRLNELRQDNDFLRECFRIVRGGMNFDERYRRIVFHKDGIIIAGDFDNITLLPEYQERSREILEWLNKNSNKFVIREP